MDFLYFDDGSRVRGVELTNLFTALPDNFAPSARPLADMVTATDKVMVYPVAGHFDDANGDTLTLSAQVLVGSDETGWTGAPLPEGLRFNAERGTFQGQVTAPGTYMIAVSADDGQAVTMQRFTLTVNEANVAPVYQGESQVTVTAGEFISVPVTFTDKNGDTLTYQHSTLPAWLHHDADNQTLSGMVPLDAAGTHNITLTATDPAGLVANATVQLTIAAAKARTIASVPLAHQQMHYGSVQHIEIASHFTQPDGIQRERLSYDVSLQQADGSYQPLSSKDWLQWQDGQLYSAPPQAAVGVHYVRITATDSSGEQQQGEFRLTVTGPQAKDAGVIETVKAEPISIDVRQYFSGLNANAKYGVRVSLATEEATPAPSPSPAEINLAAVPMTMMSSPSVSTSTADDAPEVVIPESLKHWLTFNTETGILSGKPPEDFLDRLRVTFLAETEENTVLESHGEIMVDERATETTYWFSYDAANRVVIDGGNRESDGTIGISQHGQYFEYDAAGRANFIINNKGLTAQQLSYTAQGYLDTVRQTYSTHPDATHGRNTTVDLFADIAGRTNQAWSGINWANSIRHEYDQAGQKLLTVNHFTPGETRTVSSPAPKSSNDDPSFKVQFTLTGEEQGRQVYTYNADGKVDTVTQYGWSETALTEELVGQILEKHRGSGNKVYANLSGKLSTTGTGQSTNTYEYDKGARLTKMVYQSYRQGFTHTYSYGYEKRESYLENRVSGYSHNKDYQAATTKSFYDASGNRYAIEESNRVDGSKISARYFDVSVDGKLIKKVSGTQNKTHVGAVPTAPEETIPGDDEGGNKDFPHDWKPPQGPNLPKEPETVAHTIGFSEHKSVHNDGNGAEKRSTTSHYLHAGGQYRGEFKRNGEVTVKSAHFEGVSVSTPSSTQRHQINQGETLKSIATSYFGNPDYWYVIADANGLTNDADATLTAGQTIIIPSQENTANRFDTLTAYSVAEHIGDTTPNLPYAPVPPEAACNALATVIIVIVVIIVTVYTAGAASGAAGSSAGFGSTMQAGATAMAGGSAGAAATGAVVGSLAGQFVGNVLGVRDGFSLKEAFVSGVTAWATAGVGGAIGAANEGAHLMKAITAASGSVANAAANKLVGNPSGFSWANVAAAAGTAAIGSALGMGADKAMVGTSKGIAVDTLAGIARSGISHGIQKVLGGKGKFDFVNVAADAFGNAVANSVIAKAINSHNQMQAMQENINTALEHKAESLTQAQSDARVAAIADKVSTGTNGQADQILLAMERNQQIDVDTAFAANDAMRAARMNSLAVASNGQNQRLNAQSQALAQQQADRIASSKEYASAHRARVEAGDVQARAAFNASLPQGATVNLGYSESELNAMSKSAWDKREPAISRAKNIAILKESLRTGSYEYKIDKPISRTSGDLNSMLGNFGLGATLSQGTTAILNGGTKFGTEFNTWQDGFTNQRIMGVSNYTGVGGSFSATNILKTMEGNNWLFDANFSSNAHRIGGVGDDSFRGIANISWKGVSQGLETLGKGIFFGQTAVGVFDTGWNAIMDIYEYNKLTDNTINIGLNASLDVAFGAVGVWGGPAGAALSIGWAFREDFFNSEINHYQRELNYGYIGPKY